MSDRAARRSVAERYLANYERIAADHVAQWRKDGTNPFQGADNIAQNNDQTLALVEHYVGKDAAILDAGCGIGDLLRLLGKRAWGLDISEDYLAVVEERELVGVSGYIEAMPFPSEYFDCVVCTDVLEHVLYLDASVKEILRVLRPGGHLVIRVPAHEDLSFYMHYTDYEFVHLRRFDIPTVWLLLHKVFDCEILELFENEQKTVMHAVARK